MSPRPGDEVLDARGYWRVVVESVEAGRVTFSRFELRGAPGPDVWVLHRRGLSVSLAWWLEEVAANERVRAQLAYDEANRCQKCGAPPGSCDGLDGGLCRRRVA